jgi:hypothetical protein
MPWMTTVTDRGASQELEHPPALLDLPQPLGFLPTRHFWRSVENRRLIGPAFGVVVATVMLIVNLVFDLALWVSLVVTSVIMLMTLGLLERYIRYAAKRRFRSRPERAALVENGSPGDP